MHLSFKQFCSSTELKVYTASPFCIVIKRSIISELLLFSWRGAAPPLLLMDIRGHFHGNNLSKKISKQPPRSTRLRDNE